MLAGAHEIRREPDLAAARDLLVRWSPPDEEQAATRDRIVAWIDAHPRDAHLRTQLAGHLTASALVVDAGRTRALLTHHKKLGRWLQLGGHCDGDANLAHVALREAIEESGIAELTVAPRVIRVDVHTIPAYKGVPEHLHLDTSFVVHAPTDAGGARTIVTDESHELAWFTLAEARARGVEPNVLWMFARALRPR
jgi:8-oxo-dGTP pyrophosphatase MutT (NUDIX family)